jgi:hypothetical protein
MLNFVYSRSSRLTVLHFWLDSCIANKGEKFEHEMACWMHLEGFQVVSSHFWLWCAPVWPVEVTGLTGRSVGPVHMLSTGLTGGCDWSDRWELGSYSCPISSGVLHAFFQGELHWFRGACMCAGGALCGFLSFGLVVCAFCLSIVLSRMCRVVALA